MNAPDSQRDSDASLDELLAAWNRACENGAQPDLEEWVRRAPRHAPELREYVANSAAFRREVGVLVGEPEQEPPDELPREFGEYRLRQLLGRGGQGNVYLAEHARMGRFVALKLIRRKAGDDDREVWQEKVERLLNEARFAARLDHPGIVPVYDVGQLNGQDYFTMAYVPGSSLADALARGPLPPRQAARLLYLVARSVQYAHEHGVLHLDLKPANVFLQGAAHDGVREERSAPMDASEHGAFSTTCSLNAAGQALTDTVAPGDTGHRPAGRGSRAQQSTDSSLTGEFAAAMLGQNFVPRIGDFGLARQATLSRDPGDVGRPAGTPAYMAAEQAAGRDGEVGEAADVFGLGATLYHALTGRAPRVFAKGTSWDEMQHRIQVDQPPRPRMVNSNIPRDLEGICLKALEHRPGDRYPSAGDFAADLERFLGGRETLALPDRIHERAWRWGKLHPTYAVASSALLALLVVVTIFGINQSQRAAREETLRLAAQSSEAKAQRAAAEESAARGRESAAKSAAEAQRDRADGYFRRSSKLVNQLNEPIRELSPHAGARSIQKRLEDLLQEYHAEFIADAAADDRWQNLRAESLQRLALIQHERGSTEAALATLKSALEAQEVLARKDPTNREHLRSLNVTRNNLGNLLQIMRRTEEALALLEASRASCEQLLELDREDREARRSLVLNNSNLGALLCEMRRPEEGLARIRAAREMQLALVQDAEIVSKDSRALAEYALICQNLAMQLEGYAPPGEAVALLTEARDAFRRLLDGHPTTVAYMAGLSSAQLKLAQRYRLLQSPAEASREIAEADLIATRLCNQYSDVVNHWELKSDVAFEQGQQFRDQAKFDLAVEHLQTAKDITETRLLARDPSAPNVRNRAAQIDLSLTAAYSLGGRLENARASAARAQERLEALCREFPDVANFQLTLTHHLMTLGRLEAANSRFDAAVANYEQALEGSRKLLKLEPASTRFLDLQASCLSDLGKLHLRNGRPAAARSRFVEAEQALASQLRVRPNDIGRRLESAKTQGHVGITYLIEKQYAAALERFDSGIALLVGTPESHRGDPRYLEVYSELHANRAVSLRLLERPAESVAHLIETLPALAGQPRSLREFAVRLAECIPALPASDRPAVAEKAFAVLKQAVAAGYRDAAELRANKELAPLQELPEFESLLKSLEPPGPSP